MAAPVSAANMAAGTIAIMTQLRILRYKGIRIPNTPLAHYYFRNPSLPPLAGQLSFGFPAGPAVVTFAKGLTPPIDGFPPQKPQPFIEVHFGPLPVTPPLHTKFTRVVGGRHAELVSWNLACKDTQRAPSVKVRGHYNYVPAAHGI